MRDKRADDEHQCQDESRGHRHTDADEQHRIAMREVATAHTRTLHAEHRREYTADRREHTHRTLARCHFIVVHRSEEHTSELQSLMRISYAVFCLKKKNKK